MDGPLSKISLNWLLQLDISSSYNFTQNYELFVCLNAKISKTEVISINIVHKKHKIKNVVSSSNLKTTAEEKFLQKINRQKKIENAIKTALMPHFKRKHINKEEYKDILKKSVTKVSQSKDNDINPNKIKRLIEGYIERCNLFYANKMTKRTLK